MLRRALSRNLSGSRIHRPGVIIIDGVQEFVDQCEDWSRIRRLGVGIIDQYGELVDQDGGILNQDEKWSRKIYRVRGFIDQGCWNRRPVPRIRRSGRWNPRPVRGMVEENLSGLRSHRPGVEIVDRVQEFVDQDKEWSRIRRPSVGIVVRYREFFDQNGRILDQYEEWSRRIYRVQGFIDQELKSSTGSENSTTRTKSGRGFID
ncbi:unnamed protein product [Arabidopsis thaliana]|uniref:Uncharacterized protein n=1 Tax=Arabidopsis thaliana TaxID=3702 RepID=A0A654FCB8_ARATH|nr:unnamed protein product [Arabidopsis thaliana]